LAEGAKTGVWDIAFLAVEPARATIISFSPAYAEIDATYLVPKDSLIRSIADVDREGIRVAVAAKTAFDLFLTRSLRHARLIRAKGTPGAFKVFVADNLEALAGLRPTLVAYVDKLPESRLLEGRFTAIQQSVGTPSGRPAAAAYLRDFVAEMNASGFVARAIERHGIRGLSVVASSASAP
jgi:polar amino acid transport system substrate-binding protein